MLTATVTVSLDHEPDDYLDRRALAEISQIPDGAHLVVVVGSRHFLTHSSVGWLSEHARRLHVEISAHTATRDAGQSAASQAPDEWAVLVAAVSKVAAEHDGEVDWTHVRPIIRGRIEPKHVGTLVRRARREGLLIEDHFDRSEDAVGKNAGRMEPKYRIGTTAQEAVA